MKSKLKKFLKESFLTKWLYRALWKIKYRKSLKFYKQKRDALQKNGARLIHFLQKTLEGEKFFFDMGTLLGIVREGRLLGHDLDIDVGLYADGEQGVERVRETLIKNGCKLKSTYKVEEIGVVEDSFLIEEVKFDVSYYYKEEDVDAVYLMYDAQEGKPAKVVKLCCSPIEEIGQVSFKGGDINVPKDSLKYLAERYGENWRIPDKNYIYWKGPSARQTNFEGIITIYDNKGE